VSNDATTAAEGTRRLTVGQALVRFLASQYSERDGVQQRLIAGAFGIFGHGNVAGVGQALLQNEVEPAAGEDRLKYYLARNEQGMVHAAVSYARTRNRLQAFACTASIGPGSTNMITGAALATIDRVPVLILPSDIFATRFPDPVLQQLEDPRSLDISVNDAFKPVSRFWDRINRPEQLIPSALAAMRVLTDPAETGAVTICLPQDVQAEAYDWPLELFRKRVWHVARPAPEPAALARAVAIIRAAKKPLLVAGGGVIYSDGSAALAAFADATGIPVAAFDAAKNSAEMVVADARAGLEALTAALQGYRVVESYSQRVAGLVADWARVTEECFHRNAAPLPAQTEVLGALNELMGDDDIVINAAGSMPGDLQALWRARSPKQYHLEYGYSCMGYEIPAAMGAKMAAPDSEVVAIVGDGSYQMLPQEIATIVSENLKVIIVLLQNHGFASIGGLSESLGSQRFGTSYRMRDGESDRLDGGYVPLDLAANARSMGADVLEVATIEEFRDAYRKAAVSTRTTLIHIETDLYGPNPPASAWWDVPVSQSARLESTRQAHSEYLEHKKDQRHHL